MVAWLYINARKLANLLHIYFSLIASIQDQFMFPAHFLSEKGGRLATMDARKPRNSTCIPSCLGLTVASGIGGAAAGAPDHSLATLPGGTRNVIGPHPIWSTENEVWSRWTGCGPNLELYPQHSKHGNWNMLSFHRAARRGTLNPSRKAEGGPCNRRWSFSPK